MVEDSHVEAPPPPGHLQADLTQPDDAQGLVVDVDAKPAQGMKGQGPLAIAHPAFAFANATGGGHEEGKGYVGGGLGQHPRRVAHGNAPAGSLGHVHVVQAHRQLADDLEAGRGVQQGGVYPVHNVGQNAVGPGSLLPQNFGRRGIFVGPDFHLGGLVNQVKGFRHDLAGDEYLGFVVHVGHLLNGNWTMVKVSNLLPLVNLNKGIFQLPQVGKHLRGNVLLTAGTSSPHPDFLPSFEWIRMLRVYPRIDTNGHEFLVGSSPPS